MLSSLVSVEIIAVTVCENCVREGRSRFIFSPSIYPNTICYMAHRSSADLKGFLYPTLIPT